MLVSKKFLLDFAYCANYYGWTDADVEDVKRQTRKSPELKQYWTELAEAHRAGYRQTKENNYMRLAEWQQRKKGTQSTALSYTKADALQLTKE